MLCSCMTTASKSFALMSSKVLRAFSPAAAGLGPGALGGLSGKALFVGFLGGKIWESKKLKERHEFVFVT